MSIEQSIEAAVARGIAAALPQVVAMLSEQIGARPAGEKLIRAAAVCEMLAIPRRDLPRFRAKNPTFPPEIGPLRWRLADVEQWIERRSFIEGRVADKRQSAI